MYGYFRCPDCEGHWESAHTYPKYKGSSEYWKQECKSCKTMCSPYKVKPTVCKQCGQTSRFCDCDKHSDPNKPHRSDLCEKCRAGSPCMH